MDLTAADYDAQRPSPQPKFASGEKVGTVSTTDNRGTQTLEIHKSKDAAGKDANAAKTAVAITPRAAPWRVSTRWRAISATVWARALTITVTRNCSILVSTIRRNIEINGTAYQKSADKWTSGATQYEAGTLQTVIDKLRDLSASKFSEKMSGTQTLAVAVTSGDNHRYEKVNIDKDGASYNAQRDGEPAVYVIDAKDVDDLQKAISGIKQLSAAKPASPTKK